MALGFLRDDTPETLTTDICIVGGGAMGITLALELMGANRQVMLIESGGEELEPETQDLYRMEVTGLQPEDPPDICRLRFLGGSTNHWGGWNRLFDPVVLDTWPVKHAEILPYAEKAAKHLDLPELPDLNQPRHFFRNAAAVPADYGPGLVAVVRQIRQVTMWPFHRQRLVEAPADRLQILAGANVTDLILDEGRRAATAVRAVSLSGRAVTIRARQIVLAASGIENAVLLLHLDRAQNGMLGGEAGPLGRYYSDHPELFFQGVMARCLTPTFIRTEWEGPDGNTESYRIRQSYQLLDRPGAEPWLRHGLDMGPRPACELWDGTEFDDPAKVTRKGRRDQVGVAEEVNMSIAPTPYAGSRITLTDQRTPIGTYVGRLHWVLDPADLGRIEALAEAMTRRFAANGLGRLNFWGQVRAQGIALPGKTTVQNGRHHMGATRMADHPGQGVVDRDCRVFGLDNLYVAGASIFPSADWPGPTLTAAAFAVRLAAFLQARP